MPHSMPISYLDRTQTMFAPGSSCTQGQIGSDSIPIAGSNDKDDKCNIYDYNEWCFLLMQLIYGGKNSKSFPPVKFLDSLTLRANEKHHSNEQKSLKLLDDVII